MAISLEQAIQSAHNILPEGARFDGDGFASNKNYFFTFGYPSKAIDEFGNTVEDILPIPGGDSCIVVSKESGEARFFDSGGSVPYRLCDREPTTDELEFEKSTELDLPELTNLTN